MATIKGGQKLEAALRDMARKVANPAILRVGFLSGSTYPDGKPVAMIAAIQEWGAPSRGIPPRPFFRNMIASRKAEWPEGIAAQLKETGYDAVLTMQRIGHAIAGQLRESIINTNDPPLADSTLRKRGVAPGTKFDPKNPKTFRAKPLVNTGHMLNSIDYEVTT
jgi:hypothetical protein